MAVRRPGLIPESLEQIRVPVRRLSASADFHIDVGISRRSSHFAPQIADNINHYSYTVNLCSSGDQWRIYARIFVALWSELTNISESVSMTRE